MDIIYTRKTCFTKLISVLFLIYLLVFIPFKLWSQTAVLQPCEGNIQSWIARWTITSFTGPGQVDKMYDGITGINLNDVNDITSPVPWEFNVNFGIVRNLSGIKIYSGSGLYSPRTYQILVSKDSIQFTPLNTADILPYRADTIEHRIDFHGYIEAKYVRIKIIDAYINNESTYNSDQLRLWEVNFLQCGVDPLIAKQIAPGVVIAPSLSCADAISQDIHGIINTYFPGKDTVIKGASTVNVDMNRVKGAAHTLISGDRVLIIQMQNTEISETNSMAYGDGIDNDLIASGWIDVNNTGEYEFAIVGSMSGDTIQLTQPLQKSYSARGVFQVVYSPVYDTVTLTGTVMAKDWDGYCGGIVTFDARMLNLNGQKIDVSSQGFRKGKKNSTAVRVQYFWKYYCTDNGFSCGEMGEGIAGSPRGSYLTDSRKLYAIENAALNSGGSFGRGAPGNAGGGGIDHNSGGGGGANIGSGGQGGASVGRRQNNGDMTLYWDAPSPDGGPEGASGYYPNGGMGGTGSGRPDPFRIWMGGAGGGGHQDNDAASGGSNGGGIILATARVVKGNGYFYSNGVSAGESGSDGAGGGGAGGTIIFGFNDQTAATINYSAKGGNGGNVNHVVPHGPGGGGGGGAIIFSAPPINGIIDTTGGTNGVYLSTQSQWGSHKGQDGKTLVAKNLSALFTYSCDHGDAPLSFLDAAHQIKPDSPSLSLVGDAESMALNLISPHDIDAKGDDMDGVSDEEGVEQPFDGTMSTAQSTVKVNVFVNNPLNQKVFVCGWIDFNGNGLFDESEKTYITEILTGQNELKWNNIPSDITGGETYARFRISSSIKALESTGVALDGEVEDYPIHINGIPQARADTACTHAGLSVDIHVVVNDSIQGDKRGYITILTPPTNGVAVPNDNNTPNDKTDDFFNYTPFPGFQGVDTFTYELWNAISNSAKAEVTVNVKEPITVDFKANPDAGCTPLTISFTNQSSDQNAVFTWDFGDTNPPSQDINPVHIFTTGDTTTVYEIHLQMNTGCGIINTTQKITVHPPPHAVMTEKSDEEKPEVVEFEDTSIGSISRIWKQDGITLSDTSKVISLSFEHAGADSIGLIIFDEFGCMDETKLVHNTIFRDLYVPNSFMPNSPDPLVNKFIPVGYGLKDYSLMIFDLWGNLIWSTTEIKDKMPQYGWDGTMKGKPLPNDTYIWRINAAFENGKVWKGMLKYNNGSLIPGTYRTQGTVTIIR